MEKNKLCHNGAWFLLTIFLVIFLLLATAEENVWDCPECGRTGNTGNYCGGCAYPAPWIETEEKMDSTQDFRTVGSIVTFGHYEQDNDINNDTEEIEWIILDYDEANQKVLLLSRYGLDTAPYSKESDLVNWQTSTLRTWLNSEFLNEAFSIEEQSAILNTIVDNGLNQGYGEKYYRKGQYNTQDQIFLLSYAEANRYLGVTYNESNKSDNTKARVSLTAYAIAQGAWKDTFNLTEEGMPAGWWWLRSPGGASARADCVNHFGSLGDYPVLDNHGAVRPAFWLDLESDFFESEESN